MNPTSPTNIISTIAGTGTGSYSGDNGPATSATMYSPYDVRLDKSGNVYICELNGYRIRKVIVSTGIITTIAGTGIATFSGDNGQATNAALNSPHSVAVDTDDNIYISDYNNNRIRKVTVSTGIITTIAGDGGYGYSGDNDQATNAMLNNPRGLEIDAAGALFVIITSFVYSYQLR